MKKLKKLGQLEHKDRKNPRSREMFREEKHARNKARGPQFWSEKLREWLR